MAKLIRLHSGNYVGLRISLDCNPATWIRDGLQMFGVRGDIKIGDLSTKYIAKDDIAELLPITRVEIINTETT